MKQSASELLHWICHAGFYIKTNDTTIFIDPIRISDEVKEKADIILITHPHFDHLENNSIKKVADADNVVTIVAPEKALADIRLDSNHKKLKAAPGYKTTYNSVGIEAVPAYNNNPERMKFHPKSENWVGYILDIGGTRIYHSGDTDVIQEMSELKDIDIALLSMGGTYTMTFEDALKAAETIKPKSVVPMHYKMILGEKASKELESKVRSHINNAVILKEVQEPIYSF